MSDFNDSLHRSLNHLKISAQTQTYTWSWDERKPSIEKILWQILWTAANLLTAADLKKMKICGDEVCGWLFLDTSKAGRRAWCDMKDCGNRNKSRRFYSRNRESRAVKNGK